MDKIKKKIALGFGRSNLNLYFSVYEKNGKIYSL